MAMSSSEQCLRIITFDGGSQEIPSFSQLAILEEVLSRIAFDLNIQVDDAKDMRPADFFELFAGTGFGGLSVIFFTRLNFTLSQALESHRILHDQLLATPDWIKGDMESCSATLQRLLDVITRKHGRGIILDDYLDDPRSPKGFVCAMNPTTVTTPRLLRTYRSRTNFGPRCTIRQAACTALADQLHLPAIQIPDDGETFIGAHLGFNNPTGVVLPEIPNAFPKAKHVSCIVNLGAGHAGFATIPAGGPTLEVLRKAAQDCEKVAESILSRSYNLPGLFHRLSVEHGVQTSFVASTPIATRATIASHTKAYLELTLTSDAVDKLVESVVKPEATIPVKQLLSWAGPNEPAKMQKDVDHIRSSIDNQIFRDIQAWLKPLDQVEKHESAIEARTEGTCEWFLDHSSFTNWQDNPKSFLWVHGGMGTGKTTLFSSAVEFLSNVEGVLAYYYFDVRDSTSLTVRAMLVSLVCQAIFTNWDHAQAFYGQHGHGSRQPNTTALLNALSRIAQAASSPVFILVDALDECPEAERSRLLTTIVSVSKWSALSLRIMVTSRDEVDIFRRLSAIQPQDISISAALVVRDIEAYVDEQLAQDKWTSWPPQEVENIRTKLLGAADGMFRLVVCHIEMLNAVETSQDLRNALKTLPPTLRVTYDHILLHLIPEGSRQRTLALLRYLTFAVRPPSLNDVVDILAVDLGDADDDVDLPVYQRDNRFIEPTNILRLARSLVKLRSRNISRYDYEANSTLPTNLMTTDVYLSHASVREHLLLDQLKWYSLNEKLSHGAIARACIAYVLYHLDRWEVWSSDYAQDRWWQHVPQLSSPQLLAQQKILFLSNPKTTSLVLAHYGQPFPLCAAISLRLSHLAESILEAPQPTDVLDAALHTLAAAADGFERFCGTGVAIDLGTKLLNNGANINSRSPNSIYPTPLQASRSPRFLQFLIDAGADVDDIGGDSGPALEVAVNHRRIECAEVLLRARANPNIKAPGIQRGPPLHTASEQLDVDMVSLLLRFDADVELAGEYGTPLQAAARTSTISGNDERRRRIISILLEAGACINASDEQHGTPLVVAAIRGYWDIVDLLLDAGASVQVQMDSQAPSILHGAVITRGNSESVLLRFVHAGANVNARSTEYGTPLQLAAEIASIQVVRTLIEAGADLVAAPGPSGSAIEIAIRANRPDVVQLLVTKGVSANSLVNTLVEKRINIEEQEGGSLSEDVAGWIFRVDPSEDVSKNPNSTTVLAFAASKGYPDVVKVLLELGADPNAPSNVHGSALQAVIEGAAAEGYGDVLKIHYASNVRKMATQKYSALVATIRLDITQQLVNAGAIPDAKCLHTAALMDDIDLVKLFIATGTNINAKSDEPYGNALQAAVVGRSAAIVQLLLQAGADINIECGTYGSTLGAAIALHVHEIIPLLLGHKPDVNIPISTSDRPIPGNNLGGPPLVVAAGHRLFEDSSILEDLLTAGADINATGPNGSALGTAIMAEKHEFVSFLLSNGADTTIPVGDCGSPLEFAAYLGSTNVVEMLLKAGADINFTASSSDSHGSPLGEAVAEGEIEIVRILLQHGANVHIPCSTCGPHISAVKAKMAQKKTPGNKKKDWQGIINLLTQYGAIDQKVPKKSRKKGRTAKNAVDSPTSIPSGEIATYNRDG